MSTTLVNPVSKYEDAIEGLYTANKSLRGMELVKSLCYHFYRTLGADYVLVGKLISGEKEIVKTVAVLNKGQLGKNFDYDLKGTPCEVVIKLKPCCYPRLVSEMFPEDDLLRKMAIEGYAGASLYNSRGKPVGIMAALFHEEIADEDLILNIIKMYSSSMSSEIAEEFSEN